MRHREEFFLFSVSHSLPYLHGHSQFRKKTHISNLHLEFLAPCLVERIDYPLGWGHQIVLAYDTDKA